MKALIVAAVMAACAVAVVAPLALFALVVEPRMRRSMDAHERTQR